MSDVNINDIVLIKVVIVLGGSQMLNVFHVLAASDNDGPDFMTAAEVWTSAAYYTVRSQITNTAVPTSVSAQNLTTGNILCSVPVSGWAPANTGDALPYGVSALVTFPTATSRRRGRTFIPGFCESDGNGAVWTSGTVGAMGDFADIIINGYVGGTPTVDFLFVVADAVNPSTDFSLPTGTLIRSIPAYQRRRKQGVGI